MSFLTKLTQKTLLLGAILATSAGTAWAQKSLPYSYGFEESAASTSGWSETNCHSSSENYQAGASTAHGGNYVYRFYFWSSTTSDNPQYLISPELATSSNGLNISFWYKAYSSSYPEKFKFGYSSTNTDAASFTWEEEKEVSSTAWAEYTTTCPAGTKYICIAYTATNQYYFYIDDLSIEEASPYPAPKAFAPTGVTSNSASFSWTNGGEETAWQIAYSTTSGFDADGVTQVAVTSNPYTLTGLTAETTYYARIRADYGSGNYSTWSDEVSFMPSAAVDMTVNDGTSTNGYVPFYGSYVDTDGTMSQFIIPASSLTNLQGRQITKLSFYTNSSSDLDFGAATFNVFMGETSATAFENTTFDWTGMTGVASNTSVNVTSGVMTITLDTPFDYGDGNLMVGFNLASTGTWKSTTWYGVSATNAAIYKYSTTTSKASFLPKMTITSIENDGYVAKPKAVTASSIAATTATISWTAGGSETSWEISYGTDSTEPAIDGSYTTVTENSYNLTGLNAETQYYFFVRAISGENKSKWTSTNFTTIASCVAPTALAVGEVTSTTAALTWTAGVEGQDTWEVEYSTASDFTDAQTTNVSTTSATTLTGLASGTTYYARVRANCGGGDYSAWTEAVSFTTPQVAISADDGYTDDFETACNWMLINGTQTNAWAWGEATNNGGSKALYISNDGGTTNAYTNNAASTVYATKIFSFAGGAYTFAYDWISNGEGNYDYMRVALAPANVEFTAGTQVSDLGTTGLPSGWIALDGGSKLNAVTEWQHKSVELNVEAGNYKVVLFWKNDNSGGNQPAAAIDNFSVSVLTCPTPTGLAVSDVDAHSAKLTWIETSNTWEVYCSTESTAPAADVTVTGTADNNTYTFTGLKGETTYYVWVRSVSSENRSEWAGTNFTTEASCIAPSALAVSTVTINSATLTWTDETEQSKWEVSYSTTSGDRSTVIPVTEKSYEITGLTAGTTYYASVRAVNSDEDKSAWSSEISFTPGMLIANEGTQTNSNVPIYGYYADNTTGIRSQFIIPATSLSAINGNQIDKIAFYCSNASKSWGNAEFDVYLKEVENTAFESATLAAWDDMSKVFSGKLSVSGGQMMVEFSDPFAYNGGNLMIGVCQTAKGSENSSAWYGITTSEYTALGGYATSISRYQFLPKTSIYYSPVVIAPKMVVSEEAKDFGLVAQNSEQSFTFTIENKGKADLTGIAVTSDNDAITTTEVSNQTIAVGGEAITVTVTLNTETAGEYNGTITVSATDQEPATIAVSGTVRDADKLFIDFSENNPMPATWSMASGWSVTNEMAYNSGTAANIISGEVVVAEGGENIFFDYKGANTWGETYDYVKVYYATTGNDSEADWTLIEDASFGSTDATTWKQAKVTVPANAKYICLQGKYIYIDNFYGLSLPMTPYMEFTASDYSFGMVSAATTTETYTIKNTGKGTLTGLSVTSDNENFTVAVADDATSIAAGGQATFTVTMKADVKGAQSGVITVAADGFDDITFNVSGYVVDDSKFYETFANNTLPSGWDVTGNADTWNFTDGVAKGSYSSNKGYLVTPSLTVDGTTDVMVFQAKSTYNGSVTITVEKSLNGGDWASCKSISLSSSDYNVVKMYTIDGLEAGSYKFRFVCEDYELDNVNGFTLNANAPELAVSPTTDAAFGTVNAQPEAKTYTITNSGTGTLTGTIASDNEAFTVSESEFSLGAGESMTFDIALVFDKNYGEKAATITVHPANAGLNDVTINATATTKDPNIWEEDFAEGIPSTWTNSGFVTNYYGHTGEAYTTTAGSTLTTPRLEAYEGNMTLSFDVIAPHDDLLTVAWSNTREGEQTTIGTYNSDNAGTIQFTAPAAGYYYLHFSGQYVGVDNFYGFKEAPLAHDATIADKSIPATGNQYVGYTATVTVKEMAGKAEELTAKFFIGNAQYGEDIVETVEANGTKIFTVSFTPEEAVEGDAYFTVSNTNLSLETEKVAVTIAAAPEISEDAEWTQTDDGTLTVAVVKYTAQNGWNTIAMPFQLTEDNLTSLFGEGYQVYEQKGYDNGKIAFGKPSIFSAGFPYLVYTENAPAGQSNLLVNNVSLTTAKSDANVASTYAPVEEAWGVNANGIIATGTVKPLHATITMPEGVDVTPRIAFEVSVTSNSEWASLFTAPALDFEAVEAIKAYTATVDVEKSTVTLNKVENVQAQTGVILNAAKGNYYVPLYTGENKTDKGDLKGSTTQSTYVNSDYKFYGLSYDSENNYVQFTRIEEGGSISKGKAYLQLPADTEANAFSVVFGDEATGISQLRMMEDSDNVFDMNGRQMSGTNLKKGLYIKNGKKVLVK